MIDEVLDLSHERLGPPLYYKFRQLLLAASDASLKLCLAATATAAATAALAAAALVIWAWSFGSRARHAKANSHNENHSLVEQNQFYHRESFQKSLNNDRFA